MDQFHNTLVQLAAQPVIGYAPGQSPATEPTALAALALIVAGRTREAIPALDFLVACQGSGGAVGVRQDEPSPGWPTSLAVLAWRAADDGAGRDSYSAHRRRAVDWILEARGTTLPKSDDMGHNTQLVAWSWADKTHSWIEPTAMHVLALKRSGLGTHARVREAVSLLVDRLLPEGGCNYGNTVVLGQTLRAHVQPTGLAMLALAGDSHKPDAQARDMADGRNNVVPRLRVGLVERSLDYLQRSLIPPITATSLSWALLGLRAHGVQPPNADALLAAACERVQAHDRSPHKLALLALAANSTSLDFLVAGRERPG